MDFFQRRYISYWCLYGIIHYENDSDGLECCADRMQLVHHHVQVPAFYHHLLQARRSEHSSVNHQWKLYILLLIGVRSTRSVFFVCLFAWLFFHVDAQGIKDVYHLHYTSFRHTTSQVWYIKCCNSLLPQQPAINTTRHNTNTTPSTNFRRAVLGQHQYY